MTAREPESEVRRSLKAEIRDLRLKVAENVAILRALGRHWKVKK